MAKMMVVSLAFALVVCGLLWSTAEAQGKPMVQDTYKERALDEKPIPANPNTKGCNADHQCRGGSRRLSNLQVSSHGVQQPIRGN
ncbi:hypothetical protein SASPL_113847 [Salvia splendens]|uniref:Uncharacterized protein n=1 Tax=Salvia splendens TaxID=180675 RepID=A0A8X8Y5C4_SALSN|nr:hypothetical protein SASPL_113847 [Salvia splendens]